MTDNTNEENTTSIGVRLTVKSVTTREASIDWPNELGEPTPEAIQEALDDGDVYFYDDEILDEDECEVQEVEEVYLG